ncbi:MAG TPA: glucose-6-phosphate dehydrogenase [Caulobacteraceae bacterium]|nr:glucose-6-phosphate dehydrogenase [Caulobacteraceae bacterium]
MSVHAIVIIGATGDLAQTMLYPSLYFLDAEGHLPADFRIIGGARSELTDEAFIGRVEASVRERAEGAFKDDVWQRYRRRLAYCPVNAERPATFRDLATMLGGGREVIFYFSTSPSLYDEISANLRDAELAKPETRVIVEKPIGRDLATCIEINDALARTFDEREIFRIDHYLGKETVQNLIALRFANTLFEPLWNKVSIDHVQITVGETIGVGGRWSYYDDYGALRDMVQNHVLQLLCLVAMEPPASLDPDSVRNEKVKVLRSLRPITGRDVERKTVRGQYRAGVADAGAAVGYLDEAGGRPSDTETFVAVQANVDNWRWAGVPFYLRTGKRLPIKSSQIVIQFRDVPHSIFAGDDMMANRLTIRLQPEEEIALTLMNKTPSLEGMELRPVALNLSLTDAFRREAPRRRIAYERLLLEAIQNNQTLFVRRDEAEAAWHWIDAIEEGWRKYEMKPAPYAAGSWGPSGAFALTERNGHSWYE